MIGICALLLAGLIASLHDLVTAHFPDDRLPRWDFWPPLAGGARFTGRYLSSQPGGTHLKRQSFKQVDLFQLQKDNAKINALLYGSVLLDPIYPKDPATDVAVQTALQSALKFIKMQANVHVSPVIKLVNAIVYPLKITGDDGQSEMTIIQKSLGANGQMYHFKSHVTFGFNFYLTMEDAEFNLRHQVVVALDREAEHNVFQHTFSAINEMADLETEKAVVCGFSGNECSVALSGPRILSYNVWNTNPSFDVYGPTRRWNQYLKRLDHLVGFIKNAQADIIGFQEVRYDGVFGEPGNHAQVKHLADRLPGYQYVYQAAMSYINSNVPYERIEEGPAIFSKYPVLKTDYLLLSRDPNDPNDSHQRLCLHAVVDYPSWGKIDVYVTHLSLSERSREQTMVEIWEFMRQGKGMTQILLGDLNAEPQSRGIRFLSGKSELFGQMTDMKDAWLEKHVEAEPQSSDLDDRKHKFTFPSDRPSKRIDFVLYRGEGQVEECNIIGQKPTEDTKDFPNDVGMLHASSPIYASDHRGVIVQFK
ncbi:RxLR-like protein [Plasmopara halstedii]|uniref:RxLR-like protein n=1 Tax=Plasmopara halstedii TaxID=4781 RepID=A0A0P1AQ24_PLAHL|nr:RxLR-like protein [Plasmopara halstedii]CEG43406.1 RxLR-like protein [Plasmopara halstedii]|eukprot:XP_024579775.1 RxLR-like protein [Plasmopara halstedii]